MTSPFKDYFSDAPDDYRRFRPGYPPALFSYLSSVAEAHERAWDCGTGNGQSAGALAQHFSQVVATDASQAQIAQAVRYPGVQYYVALAEASGLPSRSIDLITVAQALHWFDLDAFSLEVARVLKPGGVLAVWSYGLVAVAAEIDTVIQHLYAVTLRGYWPPERVMVDDGYRGVQLPLTELSTPSFHLSVQWDLAQLLGYLSTWSAVKIYTQQMDVDPIERVHSELLDRWGEPTATKPIRWPLHLRLWKNISAEPLRERGV